MYQIIFITIFKYNKQSNIKNNFSIKKTINNNFDINY